MNLYYEVALRLCQAFHREGAAVPLHCAGPTDGDHTGVDEGRGKTARYRRGAEQTDQ